MSIIRFGDLKAVPWKNGLGITREIAVEPPGASMDEFLWRVSIADVDTASPFSRFPGVDRTIVLLEGDGFTMTLDSVRKHALTVPCEPFAFAGEAHVDVALAGGATRDFNLMVRRGKVRGDVEVIRGPCRIDLSGVALLHLASGEGSIDGVPCAAGDTAMAPRATQLGDDAIALLVRVAFNPAACP